MATLIIPDDMPIAALAAMAAANGKRLRYQQEHPSHKDAPHGHHRRTHRTQPACRLADQTLNR